MQFNTVGDVVKFYRHKNNLSQWDLADKLKVHAQYVSNVERGVHVAPTIFVCRLTPLLSIGLQRIVSDLLRQEYEEKLAVKIKSYRKPRKKKS